MSTRHIWPSKLHGLVVPLFCILVTAYFIHHAFQGKLGVLSQAQLGEKTRTLQIELAEVTSQREKMETKVALLRAGTIEKDMLDEQARFHLNVMRDNEIVIQRNSQLSNNFQN